MLSCAGLVLTAGRCVNRGFLRFERVVSRRLDRATRALGPVFVATAIVLIGLSAFAYFEVRQESAMNLTRNTLLTAPHAGGLSRALPTR